MSSMQTALFDVEYDDNEKEILVWANKEVSTAKQPKS